uniref:Uncharacterized protein n=1 Tax=Candidatus Kentrum sp. MB TaxID=2138164 RepID=A0A450XRG4_9GAMM|nr:MAG: hypothetical protein BECKMB1821G_GA0114241_10956 [Candidatus Kentron sp. MB]VFK34833.1 MAG: hypothetical protein BECKMB1821I_GA0114274_10866 [Candidatus Kentron sp. MB]VFK76972.1 MAG: hypothetical protein BECKMB1821H_GA0114242_10876 [Candidatus Kentron sp. MB]
MNEFISSNFDFFSIVIGAVFLSFIFIAIRHKLVEWGAVVQIGLVALIAFIYLALSFLYKTSDNTNSQDVVIGLLGFFLLLFVSFIIEFKNLSDKFHGFVENKFRNFNDENDKRWKDFLISREIEIESSRSQIGTLIKEIRKKEKTTNEFVDAFLRHDELSSNNGAEPSRSMYVELYNFLNNNARDNDFWMNEDVFTQVWPFLIRATGSYHSISDLSIYSSKQGNNSDRAFWEDRVSGEIKVLDMNHLLDAGRFKKIIVYSACSVIDANLQDVACNNGKTCNYASCRYEGCMVKIVATAWKNRLQNPEKILLILSRSDISDRFDGLNKRLDKKKFVGSLDIGLFGDEYIGEEYKYTPDFSSKSVSFLYRFRKDDKIVEKVKSIVFSI